MKQEMQFAAILLSLMIGFVGGHITSGFDHPRPDLTLVHEMRQDFSARCKSSPEVLAEIDQNLPDNDEGLISSAMIRHVFKDVVNHC